MRKKSKYTEQDIKAWAECYEEVGSFAGVARKFGVKYGTIYFLISDKVSVKNEENVSNKKCIKCNEDKPIENFEFRNDTKKYRNVCVDCRKASGKKYYENHKEEIILKVSRWKDNNKDSVRKANKKWAQKNKDKVNAKSKRWKVKNTDHLLRYNNVVYHKRKKDPMFMLGRNLRTRLYVALKRNYKSGSAVGNLGCSIDELKLYLELKFYPHIETNEPMTWENYGKYGWHIDHIVPLSSFNLQDKEELKKACHYTNLQPLWAEDNFSKGAKISEEFNNVEKDR